MKTLVFATSNKGKFAWLERSLKIAGLFDTQAVMKKMDLVEIQSDNLEEISLYKAQQAYKALQQPVLVMDGGFYVHELNGFPGPFARYMFDQMGVHAIAKLAGTLGDKSCIFRNVVTYMDGPDSYRQFHDDTGSIYTLTDQVWPEDHPEQWSSMWRILVPSGLGYEKPLASLSEKDLHDYAEKRAQRDEDNSALNKLVQYLKERDVSKTGKKFGT